VTDFEQLCEGLETLEEDHPEEDHLEEDHLEEVDQEVEAQDQSPPPLPKAQYRQLPLET